MKAHVMSVENAAEADSLAEFRAYRSLWASVLIQAIRDMDGPLAIERSRARTWLLAPREKGARVQPQSVHWICEHLDIDADRLQTAIMFRTRRAAVVRSLASARGGNRE
jgi:hypothetical protein